MKELNILLEQILVENSKAISEQLMTIHAQGFYCTSTVYIASRGQSVEKIFEAMLLVKKKNYMPFLWDQTPSIYNFFFKRILLNKPLGHSISYNFSSYCRGRTLVYLGNYSQSYCF